MAGKSRRGGAAARAGLIALVLVGAALPRHVGADQTAPTPTVAVAYYGDIGCSHCDRFAERTVPAAEAATGINVELTLFDVLRAEHYAACEQRLAQMGLEFSYFPVLFIGNNAYLGNAIADGLHAELAYFAVHGEMRPFEPPRSNTTAEGVPWGVVPIFLAGLIDGVNPCAFTTLVFFISYLTTRGKNRREILVTGLTFAVAVFLTYFAIGLGLLSLVRTLTNFRLLRYVVNGVVTVGAGALALLSLRDLILIRNGRAAEATLQLPREVKRRIHRTIRVYGVGGGLLTGVFVTGVVVSVLELACTGQVYLPTIAYMVQVERSSRGYGSLLLYNVGFIVPLLVVFFTVYAGIGSARLSSIVRHHMAASKLLLVAVFAFLSVAVWIF